LKEKEKPAEI